MNCDARTKLGILLLLLPMLSFSLIACQPARVVEVVAPAAITISPGDKLPLLPEKATVRYANDREDQLLVVWDTGDLLGKRLWGDTWVEGSATKGDERIPIRQLVQVMMPGRVAKVVPPAAIESFPGSRLPRPHAFPSEVQVIYDNGQQGPLPVTWDTAKLENVMLWDDTLVSGKVSTTDGDLPITVTIKAALPVEWSGSENNPALRNELRLLYSRYLWIGNMFRFGDWIDIDPMVEPISPDGLHRYYPVNDPRFPSYAAYAALFKDTYTGELLGYFLSNPLYISVNGKLYGQWVGGGDVSQPIGPYRMRLLEASDRELLLEVSVRMSAPDVPDYDEVRLFALWPTAKGWRIAKSVTPPEELMAYTDMILDDHFRLRETSVISADDKQMMSARAELSGWLSSMVDPQVLAREESRRQGHAAAAKNAGIVVFRSTIEVTERTMAVGREEVRVRLRELTSCDYRGEGKAATGSYSTLKFALWHDMLFPWDQMAGCC